MKYSPKVFCAIKYNTHEFALLKYFHIACVSTFMFFGGLNEVSVIEMLINDRVP